MLITIVSTMNVKADTIYNNMNIKEINNMSDGISKAYEIISENDYDYYVIGLSRLNSDIILYLFNEFKNNSQELTGNYWSLRNFRNIEYTISSDGQNINNTDYSSIESNSFLQYIFIESTYLYYDSNYSFKSNFDIQINGIYEDTIIIEENDEIPRIKNLLLYNSWSEYESNQNYTEVNLDNYEYILLTLKNYSQTNAFQTNFQVKGQIGITPIYNFGQTSKDSITGVQVQDRCNLNYSDYTSYPFYIIQSDLQNNAIYAVKECSSNSSFKFDNTVFNITYITQENEDNPTVTIDGKTYNVIPYDDLPSTATKNEENNYIPGESGSATDTGGLDSAIKNIQQRMSEIWNTFTYFTDFVGQIFSSLPTEVQTILLSAFTVAIILGLIKIFVGH